MSLAKADFHVVASLYCNLARSYWYECYFCKSICIVWYLWQCVELAAITIGISLWHSIERARQTSLLSENLKDRLIVYNALGHCLLSFVLIHCEPFRAWAYPVHL
jgi:hypothetical protein